MLLLLAWCSTRLSLWQSPRELNLEAPAVVDFQENQAHHQLTCRRRCGGVSGDLNPPFSCPLLLSPFTTVFATSISSCSEGQMKKWFSRKIAARSSADMNKTGSCKFRGTQEAVLEISSKGHLKQYFWIVNETNLPLSLLTNVCLVSSYKLPAPPQRNLFQWFPAYKLISA